MLWLALWLLLVALMLFPIRTGATRLGLLLLVGGIWLGALRLAWPHKPLRFFGLALTVMAGAFFFLPGRAPDPEALRQADIQSLRGYEGTKYVWGGETHRGIDCSGLVRCGLIGADLRLGLRTLNPRLLRTGLSLWWHDGSASDFGQGYGGRMRPLFSARNLNRLDDTRLRPGDIAVTEGGEHTLAYIGDHAWIEADPSALVGNRVVSVTVPTHNAWFDLPMRLLRWRQLD